MSEANEYGPGGIYESGPNTEEREWPTGGPHKVFDISESGASATCIYCGTIYDIHGVDMEDCIPPVGDGCERCDDDE